MKKFIFICLLCFPLLGLTQNAAWKWASNFGGFNGPEKAIDAVTDASGNIIVAGTMESQTMVCGPTVLGNNGQIDFILIKYSPLGNILWALNFGNTNQDMISGITTDANNDIFMCGYFKSQSLQLGSTELISAGDDDLFVAKVSSGGQVLWAKGVGSNGADRAKSITADALGNVFVTGDFSSTSLSFDTITINRSAGLSDIFIAKYSNSGEVLWVKQSAFDISSSKATSSAITLDHANNICIGGSFEDNVYGAGGGTYIRFGNDTLTNRHTYTWSVYTDYYPTAMLAKFDSNGEYLGGYSDDAFYQTTNITCDQNNNIYASLFIEGGIMISLPYGEFSIVKVNPQMEYKWRKDPNGGGYNVCTDISVDPNNLLLATGYQSGYEMHFQHDTLSIENVGGHYYHEMFVLKFDTAGNEQWVRSYGGKLSDKAQRIIPHSNKEFYLIGYHESDSMLLGSTLLRNESDTGSMHVHVMPDWKWRHSNIFIASYDEDFNAIADQQKSIDIKIFPNPSSGTLNIAADYIQELSVHSVSGQLIAYYKTDRLSKNDLQQIKLVDFAPGLYLIKVITKHGSGTQKVILK